MATLDEYVTARADFVKRNEAVDKLAAEIEGVANALKNSRDRFMFSNAGGLPGSTALSNRTTTSDATQWLSGVQINQMLSDWHVKREILRSIWSHLTPDQKTSLQPPPAAAKRRD